MRGIFYSTIAVLFILPLVLLTVSVTQPPPSQTSKIVADRMADFSRSMNDDMSRAVPIIAKRSISDAIVYIDTNGVPLDDAGQTLSELIINGTIYGNVTSVDFTMNSWANILQQKGERYGFATDVNVISTKIYSEDSYTATVEITAGVNLSYPSMYMNLYRVYTSKSKFSIEGFDDPMYILNTNGVVKRSITAPNITVSGGNFDTAVGKGFYMPSADGAGLLDRLEGRKMNSGKYNATQISGLESVVFLPDLQANGIPIDASKTAVDYLYFDTTYHGGQKVQSTYSWLKIDAAHISTYNLTAS